MRVWHRIVLPICAVGCAVAAAVLAGSVGISALVISLVALSGLLGFAWYLRRAGAVGESELPGPSAETAIDDGTFDRRTAVRMIGVSALVYGPLRGVPRLLDRVVGAPVAQGEPPPAARIRQWTMIIDLRSCDGCQSVGSPPRCTQACIEGHLAPEPMEWIEVFEEHLEGEGTRFVPIPCQHCQNPPCVNVCPVAATFSTPEGLVLIDQDRCIGCRICMAACPYDRRFFNWGDPPIPTEALGAEYHLENQVPARKGTVMKCDFCPDMVRADTLPFCIQACPNHAIYYGDLEEDVASNGVEVVSASRFLASSDAFVLKEELGTQPRVFYIPGHGEAVGREPNQSGRLPTQWPWSRTAPGSRTWNR